MNWRGEVNRIRVKRRERQWHSGVCIAATRVSSANTSNRKCTGSADASRVCTELNARGYSGFCERMGGWARKGCQGVFIDFA